MAASTSHAAAPHALSLKVLRLSRPTLATQHALPDTSFPDGLDIKRESSLAYASEHALDFPITPLLTLPASFGSAYVGESFACTLCINSELNEDKAKNIDGLQVTATMQTPSDQTGIVLQLHQAENENLFEPQLRSGQTTQMIVRQDLKEAGPHVLAVTVTYNETIYVPSEESSTRTRTFRKLYQFVAQQLIAVRSKVSNMKGRGDGQAWWIIEAQLENVGESSVTLEAVKIETQGGLIGKTIDGEPLRHVPIALKPQDVEQMMFTVHPDDESAQVDTSNSMSATRRKLAQLKVNWRGAMGEPGSLSTGWLTSK